MAKWIVVVELRRDRDKVLIGRSVDMQGFYGGTERRDTKAVVVLDVAQFDDRTVFEWRLAQVYEGIVETQGAKLCSVARGEVVFSAGGSEEFACRKAGFMVSFFSNVCWET